MAIYHLRIKIISRGHARNGVDALTYRAATHLVDRATGETFDYTDKPYVDHVQILIPEHAPKWISEIAKLCKEDRQAALQKLSEIVEAAEKRKDSQIYRELEFALPEEFTREQNIALANEYIEDQCVKLGMAAVNCFHFDVDEKTGQKKPHCHALLLTRHLTEEGLGLKNRDWNKKELHTTWREQWAAYANFHLKMYGFVGNLDHRSYKEQGIDIEGQPKKGRAIDEMGHRGITLDKQAEFDRVKLSNLYRIMKKPELAFEITTKNQSTFMWGDVLKVLHRYIDDPQVFQQMEARLKNSKELVILREEQEVQMEQANQGIPKNQINKDNKEQKQQDKQSHQLPVYTTQTMLGIEIRLVKRAENLAANQAHAINQSIIDKAIAAQNQKLQAYGGLTSEQQQAIRHMLKGDQLSCVVGFAGAGKTTALEAAKNAWQAEGYRVLGLAPTGRAAENLSACGIASMTLHKFLRSYESGRHQLRAKTVLILDEAGMVDCRRFEGFLSAIQKLGVKAVIMGDGLQLQSIEAGPAFRLVIGKFKIAILETIVRQKEKWQKQATQLFGRNQTREALGIYHQRGAFQLCDEKVPEFSDLESKQDYKGIVELYVMSRRITGNIWHEMLEDIGDGEKAGKTEEIKRTGNTHNTDKTNKAYSSDSFTLKELRKHQDYPLFKHWQKIRNNCAVYIAKNNKDSIECQKALQERGVDPIALARILISMKGRSYRHFSSNELYKLAQELGFPTLDLEAQKHICDLRVETKSALVKAWQASLQEHPDKTHIMLAYTNQDTQLLNKQARTFMKDKGVISGKEYTYTVLSEEENDFGEIKVTKEARSFAKGDRLLFLKNDYGLGVSNGNIGTVVSLQQHKIKVLLDGEDKREISFAPKLYSYFDHGWAATVHKAQGVTVDKTFKLASFEEYKNLTYVGMTRHRDSVQVFCSKLDFWREEKIIDRLSRSQEKLSSLDYVSAEQAMALLKEDSFILWGEKKLQHVKDIWEAGRYVTKRYTKKLTSQIFGKEIEKYERIDLNAPALTEAQRAKELLNDRAAKKIDHKRTVPLELVEANQEKGVEKTPTARKSDKNGKVNVASSSGSEASHLENHNQSAMKPAEKKSAKQFVQSEGKVPLQNTKQHLMQDTPKTNHPIFSTSSIFFKPKLNEYQQLALSLKVEDCLKIILKKEHTSAKDQRLIQKVVGEISFQRAFKEIDVFDDAKFKPLCQRFLFEENMKKDLTEQVYEKDKIETTKSWHEALEKAERITNIAGRLAYERFFSQGKQPWIREEYQLKKEANAFYEQNQLKERVLQNNLQEKWALSPEIASQASKQIMMIYEKIGKSLSENDQKIIVSLCEKQIRRYDDYQVKQPLVQGSRDHWQHQCSQRVIEAVFREGGLLPRNQMKDLEQQAWRDVLSAQEAAKIYQVKQQEKAQEMSKQNSKNHLRDFGLER